MEQESFCHRVGNTLKYASLVSFKPHAALKNLFNQGMCICFHSQCLDATLLSHFKRRYNFLKAPNLAPCSDVINLE